jgi:hypothetical protein
MYYSTSVPFLDSCTKEEKNLLIKLCGYGSAATGLIDSHLYSISGKLIAPNSKSTPVLHFDTDTVIELGLTANIPIAMADKTSVVGLGIVVSKREVADPEASTSSKNLVIVLQHTDYDPVVSSKTSFNDYVAKLT